ncbi:MAG: hypothetical protein AAGI91_15140 [Bacteroidota bacterium]
MMKKTNVPTALGVYVAPETIEAVLLQRSEGQTEVLRRFVRERTPQATMASAQELAAAVPGLQETDTADYTLEVGDGSADNGASLLPSELDQLGVRRDDQMLPLARSMAQGSAPKRAPFAAQLRDILQECRALGYETLQVAFCIAPPDVAYIQLPAPSGDKKKDSGKAKDNEPSLAFSSGDQKALLEALPQHHNGAIDESRLAFFPLAEARGRRRALALVATPAEPVSATLAALREKHEAVAPRARFLDAEVSAYASLVAHTLKPAGSEQSAFVRVGTEDTLVLFFRGARLQHLERLRSLTAFDAPETICSRVLLQQDENRIGTLHNVFVAGTGQDERLLDAFRAYYEHAAVEPLDRALADTGLTLPETDEGYTKARTLPALAVGLRLAEGWETAGVNLLPKELQRRRKKLAVVWHTVLAAVLLLAVAGLSVARYQAKAAEVSEVRQEFLRNPIAPPAQNPDLLQARVDSLDRAYATYTRAMNVLDSLLVGSDKWVRTTERVSRATGATPETWVDALEPEGTQAMRMSGHALSRLAIVDLSRRLDGAIEQLNYQDVGERRVYSYEMVFPAPEELPSAANYLRNIKPGEANPEGPTEVHPARHDH